MAHTPGPWEWDAGSPHILNAPSASMDGSRMDEASMVVMMSGAARKRITTDNARLIAAAPELLAALEELHRVDCLVDDAYYAQHDAAMQTARAAIAKARG